MSCCWYSKYIYLDLLLVCLLVWIVGGLLGFGGSKIMKWFCLMMICGKGEVGDELGGDMILDWGGK